MPDCEAPISVFFFENQPALYRDFTYFVGRSSSRDTRMEQMGDTASGVGLEIGLHILRLSALDRVSELAQNCKPTVAF